MNSGRMFPDMTIHEPTDYARRVGDILRRMAFAAGWTLRFDHGCELRFYPPSTPCERAVVWYAPETGYERVGGLHAAMRGRLLPVTEYASADPMATAGMLWTRIKETA